MQVHSLGWEDSLEEEMATHSNTGESHGQGTLMGFESRWVFLGTHCVP